jgi:hypothetical protein
MTGKVTAIADIDPRQEASCSCGQNTAKSPTSEQRERHFLDLIEDDEVRETLRHGGVPDGRR